MVVAEREKKWDTDTEECYRTTRRRSEVVQIGSAKPGRYVQSSLQDLGSARDCVEQRATTSISSSQSGGKPAIPPHTSRRRTRVYERRSRNYGAHRK